MFQSVRTIKIYIFHFARSYNIDLCHIGIILVLMESRRFTPSWRNNGILWELAFPGEPYAGVAPYTPLERRGMWISLWIL